jgi:BA14K-like protein
MTMKTTFKALALAAFATVAGFAALAPAQAQDIYYDDGPSLIPANGFFDDDDGFYPRHYRPRHHRNGFSFELQFGQPHVYYRPRVIHRPQPVIHLTQAHVNWCYSRYRTYDHRSNSFVIRHGQRAYCVSPYSY